MAIYINGTAILADGVVEPVSLTDAKNWMRIDYTSDDTLIQSLINASRIHIEKITGVAPNSSNLNAVILEISNKEKKSQYV